MLIHYNNHQPEHAFELNRQRSPKIIGSSNKVSWANVSLVTDERRGWVWGCRPMTVLALVVYHFL